MNKQQDFFEWQNDYVAAEWVQTEAETEMTTEPEDPEDLDSPPTPQAYLSTYHEDLHQRKSVDSLNKITRIVFIFMGLVASTFLLGWLYYQSPWRTAENPFVRKATVPSPSDSAVCAASEGCDPPTVNELNKVSETVNRYRKKREEYYDQIEELEQQH